MPADSTSTAPERVVVAMSGGVDSSVAAALLCAEGHEVIGVTLRLQECDEARPTRSCCGVDGIARARDVAGRLGIRHYVLDCVREFDREVLRPAWDEYASGRTPSPCLPCNERIKFGTLLAWARQLGATRVATGHYAQLEAGPAGALVLRRGPDAAKDQSYFLAGLTAEQLSSVVFPVGGLTKPAVRERARSFGLSTAETRDSQNACLVGPGQSFPEMLRERFGGASRPGPIVDQAGRVLGRHDGLHRFTVGQRRGVAAPSTGRWWVKTVRARDAAVVVTDDPRALYDERCVVRGARWLVPGLDARPFDCAVQVRYHQAPTAARIERRDPDAWDVVFERPVRTVTPGQAAVFYDGDRVLGRGWIDAVG